MIACELCNSEVIKLFLRYGAQFDTMLLTEAEQQQIPQDILLTSRSYHINLQDSRKRTALMEFCEVGYFEGVERLVNSEANVNLKDDEGNTALMIASRAGNARIVEHLCHHGAKPNLQDNKGRTALMRSCKVESHECMKILLDNGAQIDIADNEGKTVLVMVDYVKKQLLSHCATNVQDKQKGKTTLMRFCEKGRYESIKTLVWNSNRDGINLQDNEGTTALMFACQAKNEAIVCFLCKQGANLNLKDNKGRTALMRSCIVDSPECMKVLLEKGAQINIKDKEGKTALLRSCVLDSPECMKVLLDEGAQVDSKDSQGRTALMRSCVVGSQECMKVLLDNRAQIDIEDKEHKTVFIMLDDIKLDHVRKSKQQMLSEYATRVQDEEGRTALMKFCEKGNYGSIKRLHWEGNQKYLNLLDK